MPRSRVGLVWMSFFLPVALRFDDALERYKRSGYRWMVDVMEPQDDLKAILEEKNMRHFIVGDAARVRRIIEATGEGARAAWEI